MRSRVFWRAPAAATLVTLLALGGRGHAEGFDAELFLPAVSTTGYLSQEGGWVLPGRRLDLGLTFDLAHDVLVARDRQTGLVVEDGRVIGDRLGAHLTASYGVAGRLELGAAVPMVLVQTGSLSALDREGDVAMTALGDVRISAKASLTSRQTGAGRVDLAALVAAMAPTGDEEAFAGGRGVSIWPRLIASWERRGASASVTLGYRFLDRTEVARLVVDDELTAGAGASLRLLPDRLWAMGELYLSRGLDSADANATPVEAVLGARVAVAEGMALQAGVGLALTDGYGAPSVRGVLGLQVQAGGGGPRRTVGGGGGDGGGGDGGDGGDGASACPGPGCPEPAGDGDGDGLADEIDDCPDRAEDRDGFQDDDGCPDFDDDGDGIPEQGDRCPKAAEDDDGFEDDDGCPDLDNDGDGIIDFMDDCPLDAEVFNGARDDDGCPDPGDPLVVLLPERLEVRQPVAYADASGSTIARRSQKLVSTIGKVLQLHPELQKIRIVARTEAEGDAIRQHLIQVSGVEAERLEVQANPDFGTGWIDIVVVTRAAPAS